MGITRFILRRNQLTKFSFLSYIPHLYINKFLRQLIYAVILLKIWST